MAYRSGSRASVVRYGLHLLVLVRVVDRNERRSLTAFILSAFLTLAHFSRIVRLPHVRFIPLSDTEGLRRQDTRLVGSDAHELPVKQNTAPWPR